MNLLSDSGLQLEFTVFVIRVPLDCVTQIFTRMDPPTPGHF